MFIRLIDEGSANTDAIQIILDEDETIPIESVRALLANAIGMKYWTTETGWTGYVVALIRKWIMEMVFYKVDLSCFFILFLLEEYLCYVFLSFQDEGDQWDLSAVFR